MYQAARQPTLQDIHRVFVTHRPEGAERVNMLMQQALQLKEHPQEQIGLLNTALNEARRLQDPGLVADVLIALLETTLLHGHRPDAQRLANELENLLEAHDWPSRKGQYERLNGDFALRLHRLDDAIGHYRHALAHFTRAQWVAECADVSLHMAIAMGQLERHAETLQAFETCLSYYAVPELRRHLARPCNHLAYQLQEWGMYKVALPYAQKALALAQQHNLMDQAAMSQLLLGRHAAYFGRFGQAETHLQQALEWLEGSTNRFAVLLLHLMQGVVGSWAHSPNSGKLLQDAALSLAQEGNTDLAAYAHLEWGRWLASQNRPASQVWLHGLSLAETATDLRLQAAFCDELAAEAWQHNRPEEARQYSARASRLGSLAPAMPTAEQLRQLADRARRMEVFMV